MAKDKRPTWRGRSLRNYKSMHKDTAESKGVALSFQAASTLTQAKKILFGGGLKGGKR